MTEEEIITLIRAGGKALDAGVKALYQSMAQPMLRFFVHQGVSGEDAKDVLQETLIKIVRNSESFGGSGTAKAWMWQVARNCLIDHKRKGSILQPSAYEKDLVESKESSVADIRMNGTTEVRDGVQVTAFQYAGKPAANERRSLTSSVGDAEWQHIEKTEASPDFEVFVDERAAEQCVSEGLDAFSKQEPERAYVLMLQMDGSSVEEIGQRIGRTVAATKEYLSQCKKKIQPFIAHCNELLSA